MPTEKNIVLVNACITTKIFCRPNCPPGRRTKESNRVYFSDIKKAKHAGYRACKVCKPDIGVFDRYSSKHQNYSDGYMNQEQKVQPIEARDYERPPHY